MNNIRNFVIIAHIDHGKSTLADRFLEITKTVEHRDLKEQHLDRMDLERERGITIKLQPVRMRWSASPTNADVPPTNAEGLLYEDLTYKIRGAIFRVKKNIGLGHKEIIYQNALGEEFSNSGLNFVKEKIIDITYNNKKIGVYRPDFVVEDKVIVELKALPFIGKNEEKQIWTYLKGSPYKLLLLANFASSDIQIKRIVYDIARVGQRESASIPRQSAQVEYMLNLIDTPGHVDFSYEVSRSLAAVEGAILVVDATQGIQAQTLANLHQAQKQNLVIIPVINKIDLPNADKEKTRAEIVELLGVSKEDILVISAKTGEGVEKVLEEIIKKVPAPKEKNPDLNRALIFDSVFDDYRGVVAYVRVVDGNFQAGEKIQFLGAKTQDEILEVGYFSPDYKKKSELNAGEIGYIVTGLKDISKCRVGDTIARTYAERKEHADLRGHLRQSALGQRQSAIQALPGYKEPKPMIFAGIYSADGEINKLREALEKLKLNDASLIYEPENSTAFGLGFKTGFLGLLHLEIVQERLEREYGLNLIITTPKVSYRQRSSASSPLQSASYEEPWASLEIIGPEMYLGKIMELAHRHRAVQKDINYLGDRAISYFEAPLSEIIMGFYDELKSVSQGYASMNYEFIDYREGDLVQMDVLIANEKVEALSQVVPRIQLQARAFNIVKRLKDLIPRQWFDVAIQAAIGGKILARENIPAMKKDVTGYLYGGDISRKKKLWAKQAKGKKKMKKLGKVDIPSDVFIKLLRN